MEFLKRFVPQPGAMLPECPAATLVELTDGTLLCAWYAEAQKRAREDVIYGAALAPDQNEWTFRGVFASTPGFSEGNPALFLDRQERLWLFYVTRLHDRWDTCQVKYAHSTDGGSTWVTPQFLRMDWGWITGCKPLLHSSGRMLLPLHNDRSQAFVMHSEDGGLNWKVSNVLGAAHGVARPALAPISEGRLLMYLCAEEPSPGAIWQSVSEDEGQTWSPPTRTSLPNPKEPVDLMLLASGRLALAFHDTPEQKSPLTLALSEDEGKTWPYRYDVETDACEYSAPALIQAKDGRLHLAYTCQRAQIAHLMCDEEYLLANARRA